MPKCHSTNDIAIELLEKEQAIEGTIVITDHQQNGRGQRGNSWISAPGKNLMFSLILTPKFLPLFHQFYLNIFTSLAIIDALGAFVPRGLKIKWPNDLFFDEEKIGGILIENSVKHSTMATSVIGIGLNINQSQFGLLPHVTSLSNISEKKFDLQDILKALLRRLEYRYLQLRNHKLELLKAEYLANLFGFQQLRRFNSSRQFEGRIVGIDEVGKLLVKEGAQIKSYDLKEITFIFS